MRPPQPKIKIPLSRLDSILEYLGIIMLTFMWTYVFLTFSKLSGKIPVHFGFSGKPDGFGDKVDIFILPAIATILYVLMTVLNKYPHRFNYLAYITPQNARRHYIRATRLLRLIKICIVGLFLYITVTSVRTALGKVNGLGEGFVPVILGVSVFIVILVLIQTLKNTPAE